MTIAYIRKAYVVKAIKANMEISLAICNVHESWYDTLHTLLQPHQSEIEKCWKTDKDNLQPVFPLPEQRFNAFVFPKNELRVVILGQDSYYSRAKNRIPLADGMCFSVPRECNKCPPSLKTIFDELHHEFGLRRTNTDLSDWAEQGVLLLNCALSVREGKAGSHMKVWKPFTHSLLMHITQTHENVVYILWGEFAKSFGSIVDKNKNLVLECRHPSGLAASKGPFVGNNHFTIANRYLEYHGKTSINWIGGESEPNE